MSDSKFCWYGQHQVSINQFTNSRLEHDKGDVSICAECDRLRAQEHYDSNKDKRLSKMKDYQNKNRDEINRKRRERYERNKKLKNKL